MATKPALSRQASAAPAADPDDVVRYDDLRLLPQGITPGSVLNIGPVTPARPGQNHFQLQMARDDDTAITTIPQLGLAEGFEEAPYYTVSPDRKAVQMRVSVGAPTTGGSSFPRCEHRELDLLGQPMMFDALTETHRQRIRFRILNTPTVGRDIVVGQLHNGTTDRVAIRAQDVSGTRRGRLRLNGTSVYEFANPLALGTWYDGLIEVVENALNFYHSVDGAPLPASPQYTQANAFTSTGSPSWYFKHGCYLQTSTATDAASDYGLVEHQPPMHWHTGWPTPARYYAVPQHAALHAPGGPDPLRPAVVDLGDIAAGATITPAAGTASVHRARLLGATANLAPPTTPGDGDVVNLELYPTVACTLTVLAGIVPTGALGASVQLAAGKLWSAALRYRAATVPATTAAAWRLLAGASDI